MNGKQHFALWMVVLIGWLVMPFGFANSPPTWQAFIDNIFRDISEGIISCVEDFLICAKAKEKLLEQTIDVLKQIKENNLY